jgi:hypothetical protein
MEIFKPVPSGRGDIARHALKKAAAADAAAAFSMLPSRQEKSPG